MELLGTIASVNDTTTKSATRLTTPTQNAYGCNIDESKILQAANAMVSKGFQSAGYTYVNSDDCWSQQQGRDPETSRLLPNFTKFPEGIKGTADKVHDLGFKFGIYSSAGLLTCGRYPASLGYEMVDAATFAEWGVDYLKVRLEKETTESG